MPAGRPANAQVAAEAALDGIHLCVACRVSGQQMDAPRGICAVAADFCIVTANDLSLMAHKYDHPVQVDTYVKSATHPRLGASAVESWLSLSPARAPRPWPGLWSAVGGPPRRRSCPADA